MVPLLAARLTWTISYIEKLGRNAILKRVKLSIKYLIIYCNIFRSLKERKSIQSIKEIITIKSHGARNVFNNAYNEVEKYRNHIQQTYSKINDKVKENLKYESI